MKATGRKLRLLALSIAFLSVFFLVSGTSWSAGRFFPNGDGTVTDTKTGLMWQQGDNQNTQYRTWQQAVDYCDTLAFANHDDWRAPRIDELETIIDFTRSSPAIDPVFSANSATYWSSSTDFNNPDRAWYVYFDGGSVTAYDKTYVGLYVRCVRGGPFWPVDPSADFQTPSDKPETVLDTFWGYMWQKGDSGNTKLTWDQANAYCDGLGLYGYTDWRVPEEEALLTIVDYTRYNPALSTIFGPHRSYYYWSSSTYVHDPTYAWVVGFDGGYVFAYKKTDSVYYVRCVRGGPGSLFTLTLNKSGSGTGRVTSLPTRIDCGTSCPSQTASFPQGTQVNLTAAPTPDSTFTGWSGGGCSGTENCQLTMVGEVDVIATFIKQEPTNQPPKAICQDVTAAAGSNCTANASIDNGSYDPDGDSITRTQSPAGPYQLGDTLVILTVADNEDASSQCTGTVTVGDITPPTTTNVSATPSVLWPPNRNMVNVTVNYGTTDNCGRSVCQISSMTSNEPISSSDYRIVDAHHVKLSADRLGKGNGRIYIMGITCTDASGNSSTQATTVTVPHDQGQKK
jgi:hypothetical protein